DLKEGAGIPSGQKSLTISPVVTSQRWQCDTGSGSVAYFWITGGLVAVARYFPSGEKLPRRTLSGIVAVVLTFFVSRFQITNSLLNPNAARSFPSRLMVIATAPKFLIGALNFARAPFGNAGSSGAC